MDTVVSLHPKRDQRTPRPDVPVTWIRPLDFARVTGMSRRRVYDELAAGRLRGVQVDTSWFVEAGEVSAFFERYGQAAKSA